MCDDLYHTCTFVWDIHCTLCPFYSSLEDATTLKQAQTHTHLHVVEDEEERLNGKPLVELKRVKVRRRVLVVVVRSWVRRSLEIGSGAGGETQQHG